MIDLTLLYCVRLCRWGRWYTWCYCVVSALQVGWHFPLRVLIQFLCFEGLTARLQSILPFWGSKSLLCLSIHFFLEDWEISYCNFIEGTTPLDFTSTFSSFLRILGFSLLNVSWVLVMLTNFSFVYLNELSSSFCPSLDSLDLSLAALFCLLVLSTVVFIWLMASLNPSISTWLLGIRCWSFPTFLSLVSTLITCPSISLAFCCSWFLESSWFSHFMHLLVWGSCVVINSLKSITLNHVFQHLIYHNPWFLVWGNCSLVAIFLYLLFLCCVLHFCWCDCGPGFSFSLSQPSFDVLQVPWQAVFAGADVSWTIWKGCWLQQQMQRVGSSLGVNLQ